MTYKIISYYIYIQGLVQGVGFRPFVYRIAIASGIKGWVENRNDGVHITAEGSTEQIEIFLLQLKEKAPPASNIKSISKKEIPGSGFSSFEIIRSTNISDQITEISPDIAVCEECLADLKTQSHRINYPFINCTNCGPRFTIIKDLPYDREKTTMDIFPMCAECKSEYTTILDRRFHAQPVACNNCGPHYSLDIFASSDQTEINTQDIELILKSCKTLIETGKIIAIKGIGGFHLACDAFNNDAVLRLRKLKQREGKPFAVMAGSIENIASFAEISAEEKKILSSWQRPVVLLKECSSSELPKSVSNGLGTIGVMMPYMPFHHLLFQVLETSAIVLTSGNISEEPIVTNNSMGEKILTPVCDALLTYNRDIYNRTDDSVLFIANNKPRIIRRSRGFVPTPVSLAFSAEGIFATGAELKNTFCIGKGNSAILSQHIGDLKNSETLDFFEESAVLFKKLFRTVPDLYVCDLHPDYLSGHFAEQSGEKIMHVQHHHAHIASCMAEHQLDEKVIGISFDGAGLGDDGKIWGGEFFTCDFETYSRIAHFEYIPVPGGDKAVHEPWRMAFSYIYNVYGNKFPETNLPFLKDIPAEKISLLLTAIKKNINCPLTSSCGRLFDAVACMTGFGNIASFEAEGPMRLESAIAGNIAEIYDLPDFDLSFSAALEKQMPYPISFSTMIRQITEDISNHVSSGIISARFHNTIAQVIIEVAQAVRKSTGLNKVVLSGGVFQNRYLLEKTENLLTVHKFDVFSQLEVPCNDGGISLGQLAIAAKKKQNQSHL